MSKNLSNALIFLIFVCLAAAISAAVFFWPKKSYVPQGENSSMEPVVNQANESEDLPEEELYYTGDLPDGSHWYKNNKYEFSFAYPGNWNADTSENFVILSSNKINYSDIGSNDAPITVGVYSEKYDGHIEYQLENDERKNPDSSFFINGWEFKKYDLIDYGKYEGDSAGNVVMYISPEFDFEGEKHTIVFYWEELNQANGDLETFNEIVKSFWFDNLFANEKYCLDQGGKVIIEKRDDQEIRACQINDGLDGIICRVELYYTQACGH